jgi:hypothetical protein
VRSILGASTICLLVTATPLYAQTPLNELQARGLRPLSGEELAKFLPGNTLYHVNQAKGIKVPLYYVPDGTRYVRLRGQVIESKWRIDGGQVCEYSVVLRKDVCRSLYRFDGGGAVCDEGADACDYGLDWSPGNPEGLGK